MTHSHLHGERPRTAFQELQRHGVLRRCLLLALPLLISGVMAGCGVGSGAGSAVTVESRSVAVGSAQSVHVALTMQPGNLQVGGRASRLMDARFTYRPSTWKPTVTYLVTRGRGELVIHQSQLQSVTNGKNTWDVKLWDHIPLDLDVASGPGNATLSLRTLTLHSLTLDAGPGNATIDAASPALRTIHVSCGPGNLTVNLVAPWQHNVAATLNGGIGNTTLMLPAAVGVRVDLQHGAGLVTAPGFSLQDGVYVNDAYGHTKVAVLVSLSAGIGNVTLTQEA